MRASAEEFIGTVNRRKQELEQSTWLRSTLRALKSHLPPVKAIHCLAIGSPSEWPNSQYQLAFLQLLAEHFEVADVTVWDPKFEAVDEAVFAHFGAQINEFDGVVADDTLLYVPHGPRSLNIQLGKSSKLLYLGNTFKGFMAKVSPEEQAVVDHMASHEVARIAVDRHDRWFAAMSDLALIKLGYE